MLAARMLKIPIFLHDGNARVGRANVFLSSWAEKILLAFPPVNAETLKALYTVTGMPVRPELNPEKYGTIPKNELIKIFNDEFCAEFSHEKPIALVFGGSQGALVFNEIFPEGAIKTDSDAFRVVHLAGSGNDAEVQIKYKNAKFASKVIDSTENMTLLYSLADIIFCRSGGSTVAELALFAKFAVLVPYPFATDNHQSANADYYVSSGAGIKLENSECSPAKFAEIKSAPVETRRRVFHLSSENSNSSVFRKSAKFAGFRRWCISSDSFISE
jgi:UDP-N-acetylglucosamine--N-acetylmuramyl-(pentapeptide) pyrophosphoryl-undecaprenol N-acetylglucosamine transferase